MANLTLRSTTSATDPGSTTAKGSALSHTEIDSNFILLNNELANVSLGVLPANSVSPTELQDSGDFTVNTITTTGNVIVGDSVKPSTGNLEFNSDYIQISSADGTNKFKIRTDTAPGADQVLKYNSTTGFVQWAADSGASGSAQSQSGSDFQLNTNSNLDVNDNYIYNSNAGNSTQIFAKNTAASQTAKVIDFFHPDDGGIIYNADIDLKDHKIQSSNANVVISAEATDKEVHIKIDDASGTQHTASEFRDYAYTENTTDGDSGTAATKYKAVMDLPGRGMRIGSNSLEFSSTGAAPNNNTAAYNNTGVLITNGDEPFWPMIDIVNFGGENPLLNQLGSVAAGGVAVNFTSPAINLKAAGGTETTPAALPSGKRLGQIAFTGYDGSNFGGSGAIASASITCSAEETFSTSNARGAKIEIDILPSGGAATDGDGTSDRRHQIAITSDTVQIGNENHDNKYITMDSGNGVLDFTDTAIKLGEVGSAPSTATDHGFVYAKDDSGTAEVYVKDGAGNETKISPHNQSGEWEYFSRNTATGKVVRVNMEALIREVENLSGKTFIENE